MASTYLENINYNILYFLIADVCLQKKITQFAEMAKLDSLQYSQLSIILETLYIYYTIGPSCKKALS